MLIILINQQNIYNLGIVSRDQAEEATSKGAALRKDLEAEEKQRRAAEREGRRTRRRRAREAPGQPKHVEGIYLPFN